MDEVLNKDALKSEMINEFTQNFSEELLHANKHQIEEQIEQVASLLIPHSESEYFSYFAARDPKVSIENHISNLPNGIPQFENWLNTGLLAFAKNLLLLLNETMSSNIHFARLLDNQNYEEFINNSKTKDTDIEQWKSLLDPLFQMSDTPYLFQAAACINLSLDNAALSLLQRWIQSLWFEDKSIQKVFDDAKAIVAIRDNASKAGSSGASTRWAHRDKTKNYAIELMLAGNYKNASRAASAIKERVINHGKEVGFIFATDRAFTTISKWLRDYINKTKTN